MGTDENSMEHPDSKRRLLLKSSILGLLATPVISCTEKRTFAQSIYLGQGVLVGEVGERSALIQTRLTQSMELIEGDVPGAPGRVKFQWSVSSDLTNSQESPWIEATPARDFTVRHQLTELVPGTTYFYKAVCEAESGEILTSPIGSFRTQYGDQSTEPVKMVFTTCMGYYIYHIANRNKPLAGGGPRRQGYPSLAAIKRLHPDYVSFNGDVVYFDEPIARQVKKHTEEKVDFSQMNYVPEQGTDLRGMRRKYHEQLSQPRFHDLFASVGVYFSKDDHDHRGNDSDPYGDFPMSHDLAVATTREQLPILPADDLGQGVTYRTHRMSKDLQVWFMEGRNHRSPNSMPDGPEKSLWGKVQKRWLRETLLASDATFKVILNPTPMIGPDDAYKTDNHTNIGGFRYEGDEFFHWLTSQNIDPGKLFIITGDRHWQYHAENPAGFQEFSTGALDDSNARAGRQSGDPDSTDPDAEIIQHYVQLENNIGGGFLQLSVARDGDTPKAAFTFFDITGKELYSVSA